MPVRFDLNQPTFQNDLIALEKAEVLAFLKTLRKLRQLEWDEIYHDPGLNWERIASRTGLDGEALHSIRITQKCRAVVTRAGDLLRFISLHPDHDSAYKRQ